MVWGPGSSYNPGRVEVQNWHEAKSSGRQSGLIELNGVRIWAIPFGESGNSSPRKLPCGVIVKDPTEEQRSRAPSHLPARFELPDNPGIFVPFSGLFQLSTGDLAAVYGAVKEPLG